MEEQLIEKLQNSPKCELSNEEIKIMYGIDYDTNIDYSEYISKRNIYSDLSKIFDKNEIATSIDDITVNTIAFIGNLDNHEKTISYNIRYVYGDLYINYDEKNYFENLEKVQGKIVVYGLKNIQDINLCNLYNTFIIDLDNVNIYKVDENNNISEANANEIKEILQLKKYQCSDFYSSIPTKLLHDKELALLLAALDGETLSFFPEELMNDKDVVLAAVKQNGRVLEYASEELKKDKIFMLEVVKINGELLQYASKELKNDKDVVLEAVKQNRFALEYASEELKNAFELEEEKETENHKKIK